ncbi:YybH family protein [Geodermatophilus sp. SYSU D00697]
MSGGVALEDIHPAVEAGVNAQDLEGLVALYAPEASLVGLDGSTVTGTEAIREAWAGILQLQGRMTVRSRYAIEAGDLAVLSNEWTLTVGDQSMSAVTAEVARRQDDGGWLYVVDHPFASLEAEERAALAAAVGA